MNKSENTLMILEAAFQRIIQGQPKHIPKSRKLSVRAVEEEANLGNGSGYYYPDFVAKIKATKSEIAAGNGEVAIPEIQLVRAKLNEQKRIKSNFKEKYESEKDKLALFAAAQHQLNDKLVKALAQISELEYENAELKEKLIKIKRGNITAIK
ncbi:hypothetical protein [Aeromonas caviae]|uniref:hypothetical protein n=1 Tax=Aeromonas TaxID=642 RepID=UPI00301583BD